MCQLVKVSKIIFPILNPVGWKKNIYLQIQLIIQLGFLILKLIQLNLNKHNLKHICKKINLINCKEKKNCKLLNQMIFKKMKIYKIKMI